MTFFNDEDNFLEFTADPKDKQTFQSKINGPIKFNCEYTNKEEITENDFMTQNNNVERPFLFHKFTNYAILEPLPNVTGIRHFLKIDLVNSKLTELDPVILIANLS